MTGIQVFLTARTEDKCAWADMSAESQVIYALVREAIENAGYELEEMQIDLVEKQGDSIITCKVEI